MHAPTATEHSTTTSLDRSDESATTALYTAAIGPVNAGYYLPIFTRFEAADRAGPSWNWAASLYTLNWMVFRRLWGAALVYVAAVGGAALTLFGIGRLVFQFSEAAELGLLLALIALGFVIPGLYGNAWLHGASRKKMARALSDSATMLEACARLNRQASSRQRFIWQVLANGALAGAAAGVYMALPKAAGLPLGIQQSGAALQPAPSFPLLALPTLAASAPAVAGSAASPVAAPVVPAQAAAKASDAVQCMDCRQNATAGEPKPSASAPTTALPFHINVGLFAVDSNARKAHTKLLDAGLAAYTQELKTTNGKRTRVRVGPLQTQSEADAAAQKIRALGLEAAVFQQ